MATWALRKQRVVPAPWISTRDVHRQELGLSICFGLLGLLIELPCTPRSEHATNRVHKVQCKPRGSCRIYSLAFVSCETACH